jgi:iron complex outermembrane receptor protein
MDAVTLFASYAYNNSQYQDDVLNANGTVRSAIKGKTVVDAPKSVGTAEIAYDDKSIFGRIGANYMSRRYFTYTNDQSVPGRVLVDASIGYRFSGDGPLKGLEIQGNVTNLFDKKYVATIGSNGFGDKGDNQTLLAGSPQTFFVTVRKAF